MRQEPNTTQAGETAQSAAGAPKAGTPPKSATWLPLYHQIKTLLLERIVSGEWPPGTYIPSEAALAEDYNVSVGTLRKALNELVADNVVIRYQGKGTVVATHDSDSALFRFFNLRRLDNERDLPLSRVLARQLRAASEEEAGYLEIAPGSKVVHIWRVRELNGKPVILEHISLDASRFPGLEQEPVILPNTLYQLYQQRYACTVAQASECLTAVMAGQEEVMHLDAKPGEPLLKICRVAKDYLEQPIECRISTVLTRNHGYFNRL